MAVAAKPARDAHPGDRDGAPDRALPTLIVLPLLLLGGVPLLSGVPSTESAGPAWLLLGWTPAACVCAFGRGALGLRWAHALLGSVALLAAGVSFWMPDRFEAIRSALVLSGSALAFVLGGSLSRRGRFRVLAGLAWLPLVLFARVMLHHLGHPASGWMESLAEPLGNRSDLVEFAWPGLVAALSVFLTTRNRVLGLALLLGVLPLPIVFGASPVNAAVVALFASTAITLLWGNGIAASARLGRLLLVTSAVCALAFGIRQWGDAAIVPDSNAARTEGLAAETAPSPAATTRFAADRSQGWQVRLGIFEGTLALMRDHLWTGVGPGQFEAQFPPYRTAEERRLSSHDGAIQNPVEVEHAHNDYLIALSEGGLLFGTVWIGLWLWVGFQALLALRARDSARAAAAALVWGWIAWGLFNAPLLGPVLSHGVAWLMAGLVLGRRTSRLPERPMRALAGAHAVLALVGLPWAITLVAHGYHLARTIDPNRAISAASRSREVERALAWAPRSALALDIAAHGIPQLDWEPTDAKLALERLERLATIHPHHAGVWNDLAVRFARKGLLEAADAHFERALALNPRLESALMGRISLAEEGNDMDALLAAVEGAKGTQAFVPERYLPRAYLCLGQGFPELAAFYGQLHNPELNFLDANVCYQQALAAEATGEARQARLLRAASQQLFARDHARGGDFDSAVRSYRQALRLAERPLPEDPPPLGFRLEMAAALALAGKPEDAKASLLGLTIGTLPARNRNHLPNWARETLERLLAP